MYVETSSIYHKYSSKILLYFKIVCVEILTQIKSSVLMFDIEEIFDYLNLPWFERIVTNHNGNVFEAVLMACP